MGSHRRVWVLCALVLLGLVGAAPCRGQLVGFTPYKQTGIYDVGEKVGWTVTLPPGVTDAGPYPYVVRKNLILTAVQSGMLDLSSSKATVEVTVDEPSMLTLQVTTPAAATATTVPSSPNAGGSPLNGGAGRGRGSRTAIAGAAVAPTKIVPVAERPADFDAFWAAKIKLLEAIPMNPALTPGDSGKPAVDFAIIKMDHINGTHVYGQLAKPKREGKFPALLILQWASPPYPLQKAWVTDRAAEGWLTLNIEPHDVLPDQPQSYYDALPQEIKKYESIGVNDREKNYFLQMYLADYRAVDYLADRPDWDGKTLVVMGTSMGGQQSLCVAGLHPKITHVIANEPSGCDTNGPLHGRQSGYPNFAVLAPSVAKTALYFDAVNFSSNIKAQSLVAMGFVDVTAPPVGIWTAFNLIKGKKEAAPMIDSPHNNSATPAQQLPYTRRSAEWLNMLVKTGQIQ